MTCFGAFLTQRVYQRHHEVSRPQDDGDQRHCSSTVEQVLPRNRCVWFPTSSTGETLIGLADIDTIMIKSDNDGAVKVGNRSYNYRVSGTSTHNSASLVWPAHTDLLRSGCYGERFG